MKPARGIAFLLLLVLGLPVPVTQHVPQYDVFVNSAISGSKPGIFFVDARTGLSTIAVTNGTRHTLTANGVFFLDRATRQVGIAYPDGRVEPHPFIETNDWLSWAVSGDLNWIAWVLGRMQSATLVADLYLSRVDGSEKRVVLHVSSSKGIGIVPVAVSKDGQMVLYSRQASEVKEGALFPAAADLYQLNVATGASVHLKDEPRCLCAAALGADGRVLFRLVQRNQSVEGHFIDLNAGIDIPVGPPPAAPAQAGYALVSDTGNLAVYSAVRGGDSGRAAQYQILVADGTTSQQRVLLETGGNLLRPVGFSQDSVILTGVNTDGTYKVRLAGGPLVQVSAYSYLGSAGG